NRCDSLLSVVKATIETSAPVHETMRRSRTFDESMSRLSVRRRVLASLMRTCIGGHDGRSGPWQRSHARFVDPDEIADAIWFTEHIAVFCQHLEMSGHR
ncbi:MAG: hypothetical protein WAL25_01585, partial [Acidimicrobiia bacterium]